MAGVVEVVSAVAPLAKPNLASLPFWAGWSAAGRLKLRLATYTRCLDCKVDVQRIAEWYMVHDHIWEQAGGCGRGFLCIGCIEARIGRQLVSEDFTKAPCNRSEFWGLSGYEHVRMRRSKRFADRLAQTGSQKAGR